MADTQDTKSYGLGRRKTAIAQVYLTSTQTERLVNGIAFTAYFPTTAMQQSALAPLTLASLNDIHGFRAKVSGGGKVSQAAAVKLGLARAIVKMEESYRKQLKDAGTLTRDPRIKERKKPGLKRARRAPQFSKR